jgi:pyruvate dehydrogenase phosphatase
MDTLNPLHSAFPTKTAITLLVLSGLAYYFLDITVSDWTEHVYASFRSQDETSSLATPLHFYKTKQELDHFLDYHIPDLSGPLKYPSTLQVYSELFEQICSGWMMSRDDAEKGVEGMEGVHMPITHGCRFRSNEPCEDFFALGTSPGPGERGWNYWAVLDGHAGRHTAFYLQWTLIPYVSSALLKLPFGASSTQVEETVKKAFLGIDKGIMERARTAANWFPVANAAAVAALTPAFSGSCALLAAFDPESSTLRVACTGDSRAVLGRWDTQSSSYTAIPLSEDQTGFNSSEVSRLAALHPGEDSIIDPKTGRMLGIAVTRAFGDHRWKWDNDFIKTVQHKFWGSAPRPGNTTPPYMTAEPEVTSTTIIREEEGKRGKSDFMILASDGLWDRISSEHAVECVARYLEAKERGKGSVQQDPVLLANQAAFPHNIMDLDPGVSCNPEKGQDVDWKATPEYFAIEDENAAVCLARNAMGGTRRGLFLSIVAAPEPLSRNAVDDTTIMVVFFDKLGERGDGRESKKKKSWWWPL